MRKPRLLQVKELELGMVRAEFHSVMSDFFHYFLLLITKNIFM